MTENLALRNIRALAQQMKKGKYKDCTLETLEFLADLLLDWCASAGVTGSILRQRKAPCNNIEPARPDLPLDHLDQGVWLPGKQPRKKPEPKSKEELAAIRAKAWATRRSKKEAAGE